ncbi:MAG: hypothetical protein V1836_01205 [Candidatus Aenigmatarchaeota archaeon]
MRRRMKNTSMEEILKLAKYYNRDEIPWHHHFLTLKCRFNKNKKFKIILENEKTNESFVSQFGHKPIKELKLIENLFFRSKN